MVVDEIIAGAVKAIPVVAVVGGVALLLRKWVLDDRRANEELEARLEAGTRLDRVEKRLDRIERRIEAVEGRVETAEERSEARHGPYHEWLAGLTPDASPARPEISPARLEISSLNSEVSSVRSEISSLNSEVSSVRSEISLAMESVDGLYRLRGRATAAWDVGAGTLGERARRLAARADSLAGMAGRADARLASVERGLADWRRRLSRPEGLSYRA